MFVAETIYSLLVEYNARHLIRAEHHPVRLFVLPANGLGMVLAEKGTLDHAKDVFARVREVSAEVLGDVWINLAHVYLAQNKHNEVTVNLNPFLLREGIHG